VVASDKCADVAGLLLSVLNGPPASHLNEYLKKKRFLLRPCVADPRYLNSTISKWLRISGILSHFNICKIVNFTVMRINYS